MKDEKAASPAPKEPEKAEAPRKKVFVDLATSEEQVVAYDQAGADIFFVEKNFRVLSEAALQDLSHDNRIRYFQVFGVLKKKMEDSKPKPRMEIIDPLAGGELAMLRITPKGKEGEEWLKRNHVSWQRAGEVEAWQRKGYRLVRAGEDPIECGMKPAGSSFEIKDPMSRKDLDLVLMCVDMVTFLQHESAVAAKSQDRVKGVPMTFDDQLKDRTGGKARLLANEEQTEAVEIKGYRP